jgi:hypothetical protein
MDRRARRESMNEALNRWNRTLRLISLSIHRSAVSIEKCENGNVTMTTHGSENLRTTEDDSRRLKHCERGASVRDNHDAYSTTDASYSSTSSVC